MFSGEIPLAPLDNGCYTGIRRTTAPTFENLVTMNALPFSYLGFGITTQEAAACQTIRVDPRGMFDIGFDLRWNLTCFWLGLPKLNENPVIPSFDALRRGALLQLDSFRAEQTAALNELRIAVSSTSHCLIEVNEREIALHFSEWPSELKCVELLKALTKVACTFCMPSSTELTRLLHGVRTERDILRRRYDLRCLEERFGNEQESIDCFHELTRDDDGEIRYQAARALHAHHPRYNKIARLTFSELALKQDVAHKLRTKALLDFLQLCELDDKFTMLKKLSLGEDPALAAVAVDQLDALPGRDAVPILLAVIASRDDDIGLAALRKLTHYPMFVAHFEQALLDQLLQPSTQRVEEQIIDVLGEVGTQASVAPLVAFGRGVFFNAPLKNAARSAVERLRKRIEATEAGAVTLATDGAR